MLLIITTPGSTVQSNGSTFCMIGGSGNLPSKMARTKSMPGMEAMTSVGVTPYWSSGAGLSSMENVPGVMYNDGHHTKRLIPTPVLREIFIASWPGVSRPSTSESIVMPQDVDARERRQVYGVCATQTTMPGHDDRTPTRPCAPASDRRTA